MNSSDQTATTITSTPTSAAAMIAFRRKSMEGDEENATPRLTLPSPRREPLRVLRRNNNSKDSLPESIPGNEKDEPPVPNPLITKQPTEQTEAFWGNNQRTPLKTPSSSKPSPSPFNGGRTPNAGKILSPLPLHPRKLQTAKKKKVKIDAGDELFSRVPIIQTPTHEGTNGGGEIPELDDDLLDLRISKPFDEDNGDEDDSIGWNYSLDDFKFIRKLGSGGSADVYEVLEKGTCAMYALKVQPATEDALCELDVHIPMKHKNICQMFDYFYSEEKPFSEYDYGPLAEYSQDQTNTRFLCTLLEVCDHGDLHDLIDEHVTVPENLTAKAMIGAIRALQYLHSRDIIHCDIKPANFLVNGEDEEAVIKLADFGMAVTGEAREVVGGSPVYMAPEHLMAWRDLSDDFDHRTDIYSLGVVLYEMLLGYLPYEVLEGDAYDSLTNAFLGEYNASEENVGYPILDLRKLNDKTSDEPFYIPPPIFVEEISKEAQDLILRLMEPSASKRITLEEALDHDWFRNFL